MFLKEHLEMSIVTFFIAVFRMIKVLTRYSYGALQGQEPLDLGSSCIITATARIECLDQLLAKSESTKACNE